MRAGNYENQHAEPAAGAEACRLLVPAAPRARQPPVMWTSLPRAWGLSCRAPMAPRVCSAETTVLDNVTSVRLSRTPPPLTKGGGGAAPHAVRMCRKLQKPSHTRRGYTQTEQAACGFRNAVLLHGNAVLTRPRHNLLCKTCDQRRARPNCSCLPMVTSAVHDRVPNSTPLACTAEP